MIPQLADFSRQFWRRIQLTIGKGRVTAIDDSGSVQKVQAQLNGFETRDATPRLAEFGFTSNPPANSDVVFVFLGGNRTSGVAVATNHQPSRPTGLQPGEVQVYDLWGKSIYLTKDNGIVIDAKDTDITINNAKTVAVNASSEVVLNTPKLQVNGDIVATGDITDKVRSMAADRTLYDAHGHPGDSVTAPPSPQQ